MARLPSCRTCRLSKSAFTSASVPGDPTDTSALRNIARNTFALSAISRASSVAARPGFRPQVQRVRRAAADAAGCSWRKSPDRQAWEKPSPRPPDSARQWLNPRHHPNRAGQLHPLVILPQQSRAAKRRRQPPGTVDHAADHGRVVVIGRCDRVHSQNRDAERPSVERNREDVDRVIVLDRLARSASDKRGTCCHQTSR